METGTDVSVALDAVFAFFCGYLMSRFTMYFSTQQYPVVDRSEAMAIALSGFTAALLLSIVSVALNSGYNADNQSVLPLSLSIIVLSSFLPAFGTFMALVDSRIVATGLVGLLVLALNAVMLVPISDASLFGAMVGAIASGVKCGTERIGSSIFLGIVCGFLSATLVTLIYVLILVSFVFTNSEGIISIFGLNYNLFLPYSNLYSSFFDGFNSYTSKITRMQRYK